MHSAVAGEPGFAGVVTSVESYSDVTAQILSRASRIVSYGALAVIEDPEEHRSYLAVASNVSEALTVASVDPKALSDLAARLAARGAAFKSLREVVEKLLAMGVVREYGVRLLKLRVLGELSNGRLELARQPPRPGSLVREPEPGMLQGIVAGGLGERGLRLGELVYNPGVEAVLDPEKLTMHLAVLGQTGSGKTETVKRIAAEYSWRKDLFSTSGGVVVLDVAGEYTGLPYSRSGVTPLLDAVLRPDLYTGLTAKWAWEARKTILVPYDLSHMPTYRGSEEAYAGEVEDFIERLQARVLSLNLNLRVEGLLYARHGVYHLAPGRRPSRVSRATAAGILEGSPLLVVAAPLPDSLSVAEIVELSPSKSDYLPTAILEAADQLGILDVEEVKSTSALAAFLEAAWAAYRRQKTSNGSPAQAVAQVSRVFEAIIEGLSRAAESPVDVVKRGLKPLMGERYIGWRAILNLAAAPILARDPGADPEDPATVARALDEEYPVPGVSWGEYLKGSVARAARGYLLGYQYQTLASIYRGLRRVAGSVSPWLDAGQYRLLVRRAVEGFTIVHLAPPSRGEPSPLVGRLLEEAFRVSVEGFDEGRKTLVVVEEAHNLAPAGAESQASRALLRMAREGRKWGLSLVLVSQRPGFIDPGILSQASSLVALRVTNPEDLSSIRRSVESASQEMIGLLPDLEPGQAVVSGPALPERRIPLLVRVSRLEPLR